MQVNTETMKWAMGMLMRLSAMDKFPTNDSALDANCEAFLELLEDIDPESRWQDYHTITDYPAISAKESGEWLVKRILSQCRRYPSIPEMREEYGKIVSEKLMAGAKTSKRNHPDLIEIEAKFAANMP